MFLKNARMCCDQEKSLISYSSLHYNPFYMHQVLVKCTEQLPRVQQTDTLTWIHNILLVPFILKSSLTWANWALYMMTDLNGWHLQNPCGALTVYRGVDDSQLQFYRTIWEGQILCERSVTKGHHGILNGWFGCLKCRHLERGRTVNCWSPCDLDFTVPWNRLLMSAKGISNQAYDFILANNRTPLAWPVDASLILLF